MPRRWQYASLAWHPMKGRAELQQLECLYVQDLPVLRAAHVQNMQYDAATSQLADAEWALTPSLHSSAFLVLVAFLEHATLEGSSENCHQPKLHLNRNLVQSQPPSILPPEIHAADRELACPLAWPFLHADANTGCCLVWQAQGTFTRPMQILTASDVHGCKLMPLLQHWKLVCCALAAPSKVRAMHDVCAQSR